jgi:hypothetical protein
VREDDQKNNSQLSVDDIKKEKKLKMRKHLKQKLIRIQIVLIELEMK